MTLELILVQKLVLRNKQFCNLSEVVVRPDDTEETLKESRDSYNI